MPSTLRTEPRPTPPPRWHQTAAILLLVLLLVPAVWGEEKIVATPRIDPQGIDGALVIGGGGNLPEAVMDRFMDLAGGDKAHLVIIPTASERADKESAEKLLASWKDRKPASLVLLHTRSQKAANEAKFVEPLRKATGVWIGGGDQSRVTAAYLGTTVEKELYALLKRGGVVGGTSAGAAVMTKLMITGGKDKATTGTGFDLLPGAVVDQHFVQRDRQARLLDVVKKNAGHVGFGIDEGTALIVRGRTLRVVGDSTVSVCLAPSANRSAKMYELKSGSTADLTALRRAALARSGPAFPPREAQVPQVTGKGALMIVGGGGMPADGVKAFIDLAGGPDALIVVLPTAMPDPISDRATGAALFTRAGARNVVVLKGRTVQEVEDPKTLEILKKAKGIWFGGGRQWRFVDAYEGTKALPIMFEVLKRGGVIGGSSAGATIQGDYLCRGSPLNNTQMSCEGYERGLGFLPGVAIDQHFSQRRRFGDMTALVKEFPQLLGIGLDEATAIVVRGHVAEVIGRGEAHFYDAKKPPRKGQGDHVSLKSGGSYDLKARKPRGE